MEVYECQEHSTKTVGFVWWFLQNKVGLAVCFGWVFKSACLEERLGDGFAQRCAFYLEVSSVRIGLSLTFGEQSISSILCVSCNFKLDLSYCIVFWGDHRRSWNKAGQTRSVKVLNSALKWIRSLWSLEVWAKCVQADFSSEAPGHALEQLQLFS